MYAYVDINFSRWDIATELYELVYLFQRLAIWWEEGTILIKTNELLFYLNSRRDECLLQSTLDYAAEIRVEQLYFQETQVSAGYRLLLDFCSVKPFSFIWSIEFRSS